MPHGFPVNTRRLHRDVRASVRIEPIGQAQQTARCRVKTANLLMHRTRHAAHAGNNRIFMHVKTGAARIQYFHGCSSWYATQRRAEPSSSKSTNRAPERYALVATIRGARRVRGPTN